VEFLQRIGFPLLLHDRYYPQAYVRDQDQHRWITDNYGDGKVFVGTGYDFVKVFVGTGYDLAECIKTWLREQGAEHLSVCEVLHAEGNPHVRDGNTIFVSHQQKIPIGAALGDLTKALCDFDLNHVSDEVVGASVMWIPGRLNRWNGECLGGYDKDLENYIIKDVLGFRKKFCGVEASENFDSYEFPQIHTFKHDQYHWLDFLALRQCQSDFKPKRITAVIGETGCTYLEASDLKGYLERSFCILEAYATVFHKGKLLCQHEHTPKSMKLWLDRSPVRIEDAKARKPQDKADIDDEIQKTVGFTTLNRSVSEALLSSCHCANNQQEADLRSAMEFLRASKARCDAGSLCAHHECPGRDDCEPRKEHYFMYGDSLTETCNTCGCVLCYFCHGSTQLRTPLARQTG